MNRIILVGNGFDLAHGLKSSYKDFVLDLILQKIKIAVREGVKNNFKTKSTGYFYDDILLSIFIQNFSNIDEYLSSILKIKDLEKLIQASEKGSFEITIKSEILRNYFENWADFEKTFFDCLIQTYEKKGDIQKLNKEFSLIRKCLKDYILKIQINIEEAGIEAKRIEKLIEIFSHGQINQLLFLSFNYTRTLGYYFNKIQHEINSRILYLHGNVNDIKQDDELIFGFDNDLDENFNKIISDSKIEYVDFFKSILYSNTSSKGELIDFLNLDSFEVYSFGHSFEVSDFTILREIFSHNKCNRIKVFYHPELDTVDYNNKRKLLRLMLRDSKNGFDKLVVRDQSEPMPILISKFKAIN
ncbi:MAG: hypothetical protein KA736_10465 [Crocinitomicaceae bacterium]|nr:hypothetical protein [Crocinitomicaceae bacterium]